MKRSMLLCTAVLTLVLGLAWSVYSSPPPAAPEASAPVENESPTLSRPDDGGASPVPALEGPCPVHLGCEADSNCRKKNNSCTLTLDWGQNSCQLAPGDVFDCPPGQTVHVETCDCTGNKCTVPTGTYLTCD